MKTIYKILFGIFIVVVICSAGYITLHYPCTITNVIAILASAVICIYLVAQLIIKLIKLIIDHCKEMSINNNEKDSI